MTAPPSWSKQFIFIQAYNRVGRYEEAIGDCDTAIKVDAHTHTNAHTHPSLTHTHTLSSPPYTHTYTPFPPLHTHHGDM